ncbi:ERAP1-like C-terminal domain-containing protein [Nocardioides convexus]|uniref:ERAP1-like C-terminal domain-containing protein n=1 Tax=Nocardioides convexus TaxID=2712224 RepID=UPI0024188258|nr:ERAP1-like C-terminal domain-containing protein [Nocardioides convexus]
MWNSVRLALFDGAVTPAAVAELAGRGAAGRGHLRRHPRTAAVGLRRGPPARTRGDDRAVPRGRPGVRRPRERRLRVCGCRPSARWCSPRTIPPSLERWANGSGLPEGVDADTDLRWKAWRRLAELGATDRAALDAALEAEHSSAVTVHHARAVASLPTAEAKEFAWARATGEISVPNYELTAAGVGLWRPGQTDLTRPWAEAYFDRLDDLVAAHQGWVQADVVAAFFPRTHLDAATVEAARAVLARDLPGAVRRRLADCLDDLERRLAVL